MRRVDKGTLEMTSMIHNSTQNQLVDTRELHHDLADSWNMDDDDFDIGHKSSSKLKSKKNKIPPRQIRRVDHF